MARKRASMREGPLAELFRKTEAAQRSQDAPAAEEPGGTNAPPPDRRAEAALEETVEHVHDFDEAPAPSAESARKPEAAAESVTAPATPERIFTGFQWFT